MAWYISLPFDYFPNKIKTRKHTKTLQSNQNLVQKLINTIRLFGFREIAGKQKRKDKSFRENYNFKLKNVVFLYMHHEIKY